ncbi:hypothetical protein D3C81_1531640 [compost metagenome]
MAGATAPTHPRLARAAALATQTGPELLGQHVRHYPDIAMGVMQGIRQRLGRDHQPITALDTSAQGFFQIFWRVLEVAVLLRHINHVVVQLVDAEALGEGLESLDLLDEPFGITPLQNCHIRRAALQLDVARYLEVLLLGHPASLLQLDQRLDHPVMPDRSLVHRQRQHMGQWTADEGHPGGLEARI